jgi:hypothetical protein
MIAIVFITFCSTTLSVQDGFGRMFADGTNILFQGFGVQGRWTNEKFLRKAYIVGLLAASTHWDLPVFWSTNCFTSVSRRH